MKNVKLFIFDGLTDERLAILSLANNKQLAYNEDVIVEQLNKDFTFEFTVPMKHEDSKHIAHGNRVVFQDKDGEFQEFQIYKTEEERGDVDIIRAYSEHTIYEVTDDIVEDLRVRGGYADEALTKGLSASRWEVGQVDSLGTGTVNFYYSNGMKNLDSIRKEFGGEYRYRVVLSADKTKIAHRYVDLLTRRGKDTGKRFEYRKDIRSIKRTTDMSGIKTALYGRGKGEETGDGGYTRKPTFENVKWDKSSGDPLDKPLGQKFLVNPESLSQFGRLGGTRNRFGTFDVDSTDPAVIIQKTYEKLMEVSVPRLTYEIEGQDLEIVGLTHEAVRLGDTVFIIDKTFNPELRVEARVIEIKRSMSDPKNISVTLGNFIPLSTDLATEVDELKEEFVERKGVWDTVENIDPTINDSSIEDITPATPTNPEATGLFKSIAVEWDFNPSIAVSAYEVYGSTTKGFTTDSSNLLFRGKSGGYVQKADTNQTWYFRVRAVNPSGKKSPFTSEFSASTVRIETADYEDLSIVNAKIADLSVDASKMAKASITDAEIKELNADKIVAGKLKAQFVEIGSTTTYQSDTYNPATKATPADVSSAETSAKSHADSVAGSAETNAKSHADSVAGTAETNAKTYADGKASDAESSAKTYADQVAQAKRELAEAEAKAYADGIVSDEEQARIADAKAKLAEAKSHANSVSSTAETNAKSHADSVASSAESSAKTYADEVAQAKRELAEATAKAYADGVVTDEQQARINDAKAKLAEAKSHANSVASSAESNAKTYAEGQASSAESNAKTYAQGQASNAESNAKTYARGEASKAESNAKEYADGVGQDAKSYADDKVEPSLRDMYDRDFTYGRLFWSSNYTGLDVPTTNVGTLNKPSDSEYGGNVLSLSGEQRLYYKNLIPVNTSRVYRVTFRVRQTSDISTDTYKKVLAGVISLDKDFQHISDGSGSGDWCGAYMEVVSKEDGWQTFTGLITGEGEGNDTFRVGTKYVRPGFIVNYSNGGGTMEVDLLDFEDVTEVQQLTEVVNEVSLRTTEDSIISTVSNSKTYQDDLNQKANSDELSNYASKDDLSQSESEMRDEIDNKIGAIDFSPYATKSEMEQTNEDLEVKFTSSGGVNLLKNSVGYAGTDFWEVSLSEDSYGVPIGSIDTKQNAELQEKGAGSAFVIQGGTLKQTVNVTSNFITLSATIKKPEGVYGRIRLTYDDGKTQTRGFGSSAKYDYDQIQIIVEPTSSTMTVEIYGGVEDELIVTSLMMNVGNTSLQWQHSSGEVYNTNVLMDLNGVRVISNTYNGYTIMSPEEFAGYAEVKGEMERVFTLNKDVTEMKKARMEDEIAMTPIKVVALDGAYRGWAFIGED